MKGTLNPNTIYPSVDYKAMAAEMKIFIEQQPKTRENALRWLVGTGMYTRTGKLKKQFR